MLSHAKLSHRSQTLVAVIFLLVLTAVALLATLSALAIGPSGSVAVGHWVLSEDQGCPGNQVCTEWELASGERKDVACCMDPNLVGSTDPNACTSEEGQFRN